MWWGGGGKLRFWKIRIHRYIRGKPNGKLIWKSIQNGPTPHPMITDPPTTDSTIVPAPRKKLDSELSEEENKLEMWKRIFKKRNKKKAKHKQIQAREGKDQVKSKSIVIRLKKIQL
ncbi:hypothetical protein Tco_0030524, partial [Tanacetum coccineum]